MTGQEMQTVVQSRWDKSVTVQEKVNTIYDNTIKMLKAIDEGVDTDKLYTRWVELIDKMECYDKEDRAYYNSHASHLAHLLDDYLIFREAQK